jgi:hypothetical protein
MPTIKELVEEPDTVTGLGAKWRSIGQTARNLFKAQAAQETRDNIDNVPPNILIMVGGLTITAAPTPIKTRG